MRTRCCSLLFAALVVSACGGDSADPGADAGSTTTGPTTTIEDTATTTSTDPAPDPDGGLGESVGVTDEIVITVLDGDG